MERPSGQKIIIRTNDYEEGYQIGFVRYYKALCEGGTKILHAEVDGEIRAILAIVRSYSKDLEQALKKLTNKEQYLLLKRDVY